MIALLFLLLGLCIVGLMYLCRKLDELEDENVILRWRIALLESETDVFKIMAGHQTKL